MSTINQGDMSEEKPSKTSVTSTAPTAAPAQDKTLKQVIIIIFAFCGVIIIAELASVIALAFRVANDQVTQMPNVVINTGSMESESIAKASSAVDVIAKPPSAVNVCQGKKPDVPNVECIIDAMTNVGPQSGANVTKGYNGEMEVESLPISTPYWQNGMCPVNVHWHLGAEHYSYGEYDESGTGPSAVSRRLSEETRKGFQCKHYDERDLKFTKPFEWKHCVDMEVGQTYEVHWPHSAAGACGTPNQYQTPFYDGVFCTDDVVTDTAAQIGVQSQVFTVVNDETYYWPDLMRGMIVDGEKGADIAMYTGSTTGTSRDNEICSQYSPITWQVDRKCHLVSASTFDKMCADMKAQRDDMTDDLYAHGSRELVADALAANNHQRNLRA